MNTENKAAASSKPYAIGYTAGVYDMFHVGHLNILKRAKELCDYLIVGVTTDELVAYKNTKAIIPYEERAAIVGAIKYVDQVVPQDTMDKMIAWEKYHFNAMFVGSDWQGTEKWKKIEADMASVGATVVYFPYTTHISSTKLREVLAKLSEG
ncbi:MAG: adenylyltransferase/cytidyltransferase family protein [Dehalococcoidales bacterium]|nr:adenylyltransferase/cytidyltransferase family protein [Dehalococcoidales bacterium]